MSVSAKARGLGVLAGRALESPGVAASRRQWAPALLRSSLAAIPLGVSLVLWATATRDVDLDRMTDVGLASVLPPAMYLAFAILAISFCVQLRLSPGSDVVLLAHVIAAIAMFYAIPSVVEAAPRISVTWRHVGITNYVMHTGHVDPNIDAYFSWPGFFILSAFATQLAGYASSIHLTQWGSVFFNLLWLAPLVVILRSATDDRRVVWLGAWLFYLNNWIQQDYFSPQALGYFLNLVVLGILLHWFKGASRRPVTEEARATLGRLKDVVRRARAPGRFAARADRLKALVGWPDALRGVAGWPRAMRRSVRWPGRLKQMIGPRVTRLKRGGSILAGTVAPSSPTQRTALVIVAIVVFSSIVPMHQLTPFATIAAVIALIVADRCQPRGLPAIMLIVLGTWISYMTVTYLAGHFGQVAGQVGSLNATLNSSVGARLGGSPGHLLVVRLRIAMSLLLWGLALFGAVRLWRARRFDPGYGVLAVAAFPLILLQAYGGEILLRISLFVLPFMALLATGVFFPHGPRPRTSWAATGGLLGLSLVLMAGLVVTRYGNERMDYYTKAEVDGVHALYRMAPPGSELVAASNALPWRSEGYTDYHYKRFTGQPKKTGVQLVESDSDIDVDPGAVPATQIVREVAIRTRNAGARHRTYVIITRSQKANLDMFGPWRLGALDRLEAVISRSPQFRLVYSNRDTKIFTPVASRPARRRARQ